jgi:phospholipid N-methyltransferase
MLRAVQITGGNEMIVNAKSLVHEKLLFLYKFVCSPGQIGSITPSSRFLASKMVESVPWDRVSSIAELGAGTGAITKYISAAQQANTKVLLFEKDPYLQKQLEHQYPQFACYSDGRDLQFAMRQESIEQLDAVLSGLPFFNFPQAVRDQLMKQIVVSLKTDGLFIAFQYSRQMKSQLSEHFDIEAIKWVPLNMPPAFVYVCRKKGNR